MALKLMYITNRPQIAQIAEAAGVDRVFVDLETIGKRERQGGMDTVQSHHTVADVAVIRGALRRAELLVRCNPLHEATADFCSSREEIDGVIAAGADLVMLPYFHSAREAETFLSLVNGRARTMLLVETPAAAEHIDEILALDGIDEMYVGLNDLSLGYGRKFMFELLADGTVERLCDQFRRKGLPFGFGGVAAPGKGALPAEMIIKEHYRLGSTCAILSRSFCDADKVTNPEEVSRIFFDGVGQIRALERECEMHRQFFLENQRAVVEKVKQISGGAI